jgi:hypothetical protein
MSAPTLTLACGGTFININHPLFGYKTIVELPFKIKDKTNGHYSIYDPGATASPVTKYDRRIFEGTWQLSADQQIDLENLLSIATQGRAQILTLILAADSGFFPFGPDKGDTGAFLISCLLPTFEGIGEAPYKYFNTKMTWIATLFPSYSIPADGNYDFGDLKIGTIDNLKFPEAWASPKTDIKYGVSTTNNPANITAVDFGQNADKYDTAFTLNCGTIKAANLINYLVATARANHFIVTPPIDGYIFGRTQGQGPFGCKLNTNKIAITHSNANYFDIALNFNLES